MKDYKNRSGNRGAKAEKPAKRPGTAKRQTTAKLQTTGTRQPAARGGLAAKTGRTLTTGGVTGKLGGAIKASNRLTNPLPKGFTPLPPPTQATPRTKRPPGAWRAALRSTRPLRWLVYGAAAWLLMGLVAGGVRLYDAPLETVQVTGAAILEESEVLALAGQPPGHPLWAMDPYQAASRLARHPWVARADARRVFPNQLHLTVWEREPAFRLRSHKGMPAWMDGDGVILQVGTLPASLGQDAEAVARIQALPRIEGIPDASLTPGAHASHHTGEARQVLELLHALGYPEAERVRVDISNAFLMRVYMPGNPRLDIPYGMAREALVAYRQLVLADPGHLDSARVVNFSALTQPDGLRGHARITLQK